MVGMPAFIRQREHGRAHAPLHNLCQLNEGRPQMLKQLLINETFSAWQVGEEHHIFHARGAHGLQGFATPQCGICFTRAVLAPEVRILGRSVRGENHQGMLNTLQQAAEGNALIVRMRYQHESALQ